MATSIKHFEYKNINIPVIFENYKTLPIFNLQLIFKNSGYIKDTAKKSGLTSLSAKLLNEGTKKDGSVNFATKLESKAISIETSNGLETFVIEVSCLKEQYKDALKLLNQLLSDPNLTEETLTKLKTLQISKLEQKQDDFDYLAKTNLNSIVFKNTPLENSSLGKIETVKNITLDDIKTNLKEIFNINNLIIVAGGDITYKELSKNLPHILDNFTQQKIKHYPFINITTKPTTKIEYKQTQQAYIYFAAPLDLKYNDKDIYKAKVASFILGSSGFGSRLMEEIRVKRGLAYSAYSRFITAKSYSCFSGYLQTKLDNQTKAQQLVKKVIKNFIKKGATQEELDSAKQFLQGSEPLRTETFSLRQNKAFNLYYKGLSQDYAKKELKLIENLTLDELNNFIKQHKEIIDLSFSIITKDNK